MQASRFPGHRWLPAAACTAVLGCATPPTVPVHVPAGAPVQGFVSATLITHWCRSDEALEVEACLSYLRGSFDTLAAAGLLGAAGGPAAAGCISPFVAVTELRSRVREREPDPAADRNQQAARMLLELWRTHYPCTQGGT